MTGAQLKNVREKQLKLSQSELAQLLSVDVGTVSRWERDAREIPPYLDLALAELKRRSKR